MCARLSPGGWMAEDVSRMSSHAPAPRRRSAALRVGYSKTHADRDKFNLQQSRRIPSRISVCPERRVF
jgi:hypothetical protein